MKYRLLIIITSFIILFSTTPASAVPCDPNVTPPASSSGTQLCNPLQTPGGDRNDPNNRTPSADNLPDFFIKVVYILAGFATLLPVIAVAYGGFSMVISQGNAEAVMKSKVVIQWAVVGFALAILSFIIIAATIDLIGANSIPNPLSAPKDAIQNPLGSDDSYNSFINFVFGLVQNVLKIVGIIAMLAIIISGFRYITSGGNEEQAAQAKAGLTWSVVGIIVITLSYVIIVATGAIFGIS